MRRSIKTALLGWAALLALWAGPGFAHKPSDSYLAISVGAGGLQGQWDIALRDLDYALGLDADGDGAITWGELRAAREPVFAYALQRLKLAAGDRACAPRAGELLVDSHSDGAYAVLRFAADCAPQDSALTIDYGLFFDLDAQHRGLLNLRQGDSVRTAIFGRASPSIRFEPGASSPWQDFARYVREGVWHIWTGYDHVLFLLSLLLPAVLHRQAGRWVVASNFRETLWDVVRIVTAFTLAHSLTLSLAALEILSLPARWVESAIAASIVAAALCSRYGLLHRKRWEIALAFGLLHGFGFANVLLDLGLPRTTRLLALVGFNLGVELGQLAIVGLFLPLAYRARNTRFYRRWALETGTLVIAGFGLFWLVQRAWDIRIG